MKRFVCCLGQADEQRQSENNEPNNPQSHLEVAGDTTPATPAISATPLPIEVPELSLDELRGKTNNFSSEYFVGEGSYGKVYLADLNGKQVVIKNLHVSPEFEPRNEFLIQVSTVSRLRHANFVELLGYSAAENYRLLVYENASWGTLHDVLHGRKGVQGAEHQPVLNWIERVGIAIDAAKGLEYLHEMVQPSIIHMDITSKNILLFEDFKAKIADFNISNQPPDMYSHVLRTSGCQAPEYVMTGQLTQKSDIYSFGVVLLEILTGREPIDLTLPRDQQNLVTWASPRLSADKVMELVDPRLEDHYLPGVEKFAAVAARCIQYEAESRPNMTIVVEELSAIPLPNRTRGASTSSDI